MSGHARGARLPRVVAAVAAVAMVAVLAGCAPEPVAGEGFPDWTAVERNDEVRFDAQLEALADAISRADPFVQDVDTDIAGVAYVHATFGDGTFDSQEVVAIHGNPAALYSQETSPEPGATLDEVHLPGAEYDYFLLGDRFASAAATPWVRIPTKYDGDSPYALGHLCQFPGFYQACALYNMINITTESGADVRQQVSVEPDGTVHSQTEITLQALVDSGQILVFDDERLAQFPDEMFQSRIPVHFWQDAEGNLLKMEMNGIFEGDETSGDLLIQAGFEVTGAGSAVAVPTLPPEWDVTTIEGSDQISAFWDKVWELK